MPTKLIYEPSYGRLESVINLGTSLMKEVDVRPEDTVLITSNSAIVPVVVEIAQAVKERNATLILVTSIDANNKLEPVHPDKINVRELADITIDTCIEYDENKFCKSGSDLDVIGESYYSTIVILQAINLQTIKYMIEDGVSNLIIGATGSALDPQRVPEAKELYKKYKVRTQRF